MTHQFHTSFTTFKHATTIYGQLLISRTLVKCNTKNQVSTREKDEIMLQRIKDALNAQTYDQFLQYSQQQYPGNFDQQAILIRQLQDQHYQQYIQQLAVDQRLANSTLPSEGDSKEEVVTDCNLNETEIAVMDNKSMQTSEKIDPPENTEECKLEDESESEDVFPIVEEARMWTRTDIQVFKDSAQASGGKLHVGHGETVTVRVPTHHRARCLCWEFATDNYDIGFGLYFEWSKSPTTEVTVVVSESEEEDENEDESYDRDEAINSSSDPEIGDATRALKTSRPPISLVVPIYRRDSHIEVYAGSHTYPGEGVYLLKFDNTYSLWRSKSLYYKVYYTQ